MNQCTVYLFVWIHMMRFEVNTYFWEENEKVGLRQIKVRNTDRILAVINANCVDGVWLCSFVPMGFRFEITEMDDLKTCIERSEIIMKLLTKVQLTLSEVEEIINGFL